MRAGHNFEIFLGLDVLLVNVCNSRKLIFKKKLRKVWWCW